MYLTKCERECLLRSGADCELVTFTPLFECLSAAADDKDHRAMMGELMTVYADLLKALYIDTQKYSVGCVDRDHILITVLGLYCNVRAYATDTAFFENLMNAITSIVVMVYATFARTTKVIITVGPEIDTENMPLCELLKNLRDRQLVDIKVEH